MRVTNTKTFIEKARTVHGDKYDYSLVDYIDAKTKVEIVCPSHGSFFQKPLGHWKHGCQSCSTEINSKKRQKTTKSFIKEAIEVHGGIYNYSLVEYKGFSKKVDIICKKHGLYKVTPNNHVSKKSGCPTCGQLKANNSHRNTTEDFIERAKKVHGDRYDYSLVNYIRGHDKVIIICSDHKEFLQSPFDHLGGKGCAKCSKSSRKDLKHFLKNARKVHGGKYDYSIVDFRNMKTKVEIVCSEHGVFIKSPQKHLSGQGCPSCTKYGFDPKAPATLYYLKVTVGEDVAYKIGITNNTVDERYLASDRENFEVLMRMNFRHGADARAEEKDILEKFVDEKWNGKNLLSSGNTELFKSDVLGLDVQSA